MGSDCESSRGAIRSSHRLRPTRARINAHCTGNTGASQAKPHRCDCSYRDQPVGATHAGELYFLVIPSYGRAYGDSL